MQNWQWWLESGLVLLLAATLFHALRLERALGVLKRDRAALENLAGGFNESFRKAETGIAQLRAAAEGAGRLVARQVEAGRGIQGDLAFLVERGERLADRLEQLVRTGRPMLQDATREAEATTAGEPRVRSQAERDLLNALRSAR